VHSRDFRLLACLGLDQVFPQCIKRRQKLLLPPQKKIMLPGIVGEQFLNTEDAQRVLFNRTVKTAETLEATRESANLHHVNCYKIVI